MSKIIIDQEACIGCGACTAVSPEMFRINENTTKAEPVKSENLTKKELQKAKEGADTCPVRAITIR